MEVHVSLLVAATSNQLIETYLVCLRSIPFITLIFKQLSRSYLTPTKMSAIQNWRPLRCSSYLVHHPRRGQRSHSLPEKWRGSCLYHLILCSRPKSKHPIEPSFQADVVNLFESRWYMKGYRTRCVGDKDVRSLYKG